MRFSRSCNPPAGRYQTPQTGELPPGQRLAGVADGSLWALVEDCPWPYQVWGLGGQITRPRWSPDGEWLAYLVDGRLGLQAVYGGQSRLMVRADDFAWTADSESVVFSFPLGPDERMTVSGIWLGRVADGSTTKLAEGTGGFQLSPDGQTLAFFKQAPCGPGLAPPLPAGYEGIGYQCGSLWTVPVAGGDAQLIAGSEAMASAVPFEIKPDMGVSPLSGLGWSPDGRWLTFYACGISASLCMDTRYLFGVHPDGSGLRYLYTTAGPAAWSPDGSQLAVVKEGGRYYDAYPRPLVVIDPATGDSQQISPQDVEDREPGWSPDGDILVFASSPPVRQGCAMCEPELPEQGIWSMRPDGSDRHQLTSSPEMQESSPRWSRDGKWILYLHYGPEYVPDEGFAIRELELMRADGSGQATLAGLSAAGNSGYEYDWWTGPAVAAALAR